jgi:hypothetical protein
VFGDSDEDSEADAIVEFEGEPAPVCVSVCLWLCDLAMTRIMLQCYSIRYRVRARA